MASSLFYDAMLRVDCPKCGQKAGSYCHYPSGGKTQYPHKERTKALTNHPSFNLNDYSVGKVSPATILANRGINVV